MATKRSWLDKVARWLLSDRASIKSNQIKKELDSNSEGIQGNTSIKKERVIESVKINDQPNENKQKAAVTLEASWFKFLAGWTGKGFPSNCFVGSEELEKTIKSLDEEFRIELIDALFRVSTDEEVLDGLAAILERGRVAGGDNIKAVRAYAYISALTVAEKRTIRKVNEKRPQEVESSNEIEREIKEIEKTTSTEKEELPLNEKNRKADQDSSNNSKYRNILDTNIKEIGLSIRTMNCLYREGIKQVSDISGMKYEDLISIKNFGDNSYRDLEQALQRLDLVIPFNLQNSGEKEYDKKERIWKNLFDPKPVEENYFDLNGVNLEVWRDKAKKIISVRDATQTSKISINNLCDAIPEKYKNCQIHNELIILDQILDHLDSCIAEENQKIKDIAEIVKKRIIGEYINSEAMDKAWEWIKNIQKIKNFNQSKVAAFFDKCAGATFSDIAGKQSPVVSRERARQMVDVVSKIFNISPDEIALEIEEEQKSKIEKYFAEQITKWISRFNRLPVSTDTQEQSEVDELWQKVIGMTPQERITTIESVGNEIPKDEWDYHYEYICLQKGTVGNGYWMVFENVEEFVTRHAKALGKPDLMPKQTTFPDSVKGVITRFGGQKRVADRIGLKYQGQLVGEDGGRTFWTIEKLSDLLIDTNKYHNVQHDLMPTYSQIIEFIHAQTEESYKDKKPASAIAALTCQGKLNWSEVAIRFNKKYVSGTPQNSATLSYIRAFVKDLGEHIESLSPAEMYVLFQSQGISKKDNEKFSKTFDNLVEAIQSGFISKEELSSWANENDIPQVSNLIEFDTDRTAEQNREEKEARIIQQRSKQLDKESNNIQESYTITKEDLPGLDPEKTLKALDKAAEIVESTSSDSEKVEFLKAKAIAKLWDACFNDEINLVEKVKNIILQPDNYSYEVQQNFLEEYQSAKALIIPNSYQFRNLKGEKRNPKLMQRLVAYRLKRDKRLLNLSGTGTGKTLSAIYAAQVSNAKRIFISCPNGVVSNWQKAFTTAYPDAVQHVKEEGWAVEGLDEQAHVYIVNHERFQEQNIEKILPMCIEFQADMIVIDEIHQSKRRTQDKSSQRRKLINEFIRISSNMNPDLKVLGMSATPVINNLYEGRSLLELVTQETYDDVSEKIDLNSCMNLYQHFVRDGIRMNPGVMRRTEIILKEIDATALLPDIISATRNGTYHEVEQVLVAPKLTALHQCLERGSKTIIFITYIKKTLIPISKWLGKNNFSYCVYTGEDKEATEDGFEDAIDQFISGSTEVLIASLRCVGTGIDGLQSICNRAVFFQLPWTSTEFEQAIGRLDRDGTEFESIKVYLPITDIQLPNGERWSWCRSKLDRISSKRDIAKAAVDGDVPDPSSIITPTEATRYWIKWLERLDSEASGTKNQ